MINDWYAKNREMRMKIEHSKEYKEFRNNRIMIKKIIRKLAKSNRINQKEKDLIYELFSRLKLLESLEIKKDRIVQQNKNQINKVETSVTNGNQSKIKNPLSKM